MKIYFTPENEKEFAKCVNDIVMNHAWSDGKYTRAFEECFTEYCDLDSAAVSSGGAGLYLLYKYVGVKGRDVIIPGNTFWATAVAAKLAGANVIYADCNKEDLCLSYEDMIQKVTPNTAAITVVHIGGHIAFDIEKIAKFCKEHGIALIEDCAHANGAEWNGKKAGSWGLGGYYSFYATKTLTTGEGGMVVSKEKAFIEWCKQQRNYGKELINGRVTYQAFDGFNFRISEFTAALGCIQMKNLDTILEMKRSLAAKYDEIFQDRVYLPEGMKSGYYKYIVFHQKLAEETGKVFACSDQCHTIDHTGVDLPNCKWVGENHSCPPIYVNWDHVQDEVAALAEYLIGGNINGK